MRRGTLPVGMGAQGWHDQGTWCWVCGRPLDRDEDFGRWRLQCVRPSPRYGFTLRPVCPAHYGEGRPLVPRE